GRNVVHFFFSGIPTVDKTPFHHGLKSLSVGRLSQASFSGTMCVPCERCQGTKLSRVDARVAPRPPPLAERAACYDAARSLNVQGMGVQVRRGKCFEKA
ncbi:unnamed protein product, partial [Pylaiella littoralis]